MCFQKAHGSWVKTRSLEHPHSVIHSDLGHMVGNIKVFLISKVEEDLMKQTYSGDSEILNLQPKI